jgi:hypothetical protein
MADYNLRGNPVANAIYDKLFKPEETPPYDGPLPDKPAGLDELPPNINMSAAPIKNLSELKTKTPQEQYEHDVQMKNPASAYARKEKEDLKNITEVAKEAGVLDDDGANTMNISFDDADLASQTPAGEASADGILPGSDGWVNQTDNPEGDGSTGGSGSSSAGSTDTSNGSGSSDGSGSGSGDGSGNDKTKEKAKQESKYKLRSIMDAYNEGLIDEKSRDYLIVDALSKFARNTGKDLANLAAAYTGGSMNNDRESGIWEERNKAMAGKAIGAEGNKLRSEDNYDLDYQSQKLDLAKKRIQMVPAQNFQKAAENLRNSGNATGAALMDLIAAASTNGVDPEEYIVSLYATDPNVKQLVDNSMGALSGMVGVLGDLTGDIEELVKSIRGKAENSTNKSTGRRMADAAFGGNPLYNAVTNYMDNK